MAIKADIIICITENQVYLQKAGENIEDRKEISFAYNNFQDLPRSIKNYINVHNLKAKNALLVVDDRTTYRRIVASEKKNRSDLKKLAELDTENFSYYESLEQEQYFIYHLFIFPELNLAKYYSLSKKAGINFRALIPLEQLLLMTRQQAIYFQHLSDPKQKNKLMIKAFDGSGGFYQKTIITSPENERLNMDRLLTYIKREEIIKDIDNIPVYYDQEIDLANKLMIDLKGLENEQVVSLGERSEANKTIKKLNRVQKTSMFFIASLLIFVLLLVFRYVYKYQTISQDIADYSLEYKQIAAQVDELKGVEIKTKQLNEMAYLTNSDLSRLYSYLQQNKIKVLEFKYDREKKIVSVVGRDSGDLRYRLISDIKGDAGFSVVNLIYAKHQVNFVEFKIVVTLRQ